MRKVLRSLPEIFSIKLTIIKEVKDIDNMRLDELIRYLQTFEINLDELSRKKSKVENNITLQVIRAVPTDIY